MFGNGKGLFGGGMMAAQPQMPAYKAPEGPSRTQRGLGIIGDMLATLGGGQAQFMPNLLHQRQIQDMQGYRAQQAKDQRETEMQDWLARQAWERANPAPQQPDAFDRALLGAGIDPQSEQGRAMYRDRASALATNPNDQFVSVSIPGVGTYVGPRSGMAGAFGAAPAQTNRPAIGSTVTIGGSAQPTQDMSASSGPPTSTTTPEGLGAMVAVHGYEQVQQWLRNGQLTIGNR